MGIVTLIRTMKMETSYFYDYGALWLRREIFPKVKQHIFLRLTRSLIPTQTTYVCGETPNCGNRTHSRIVLCWMPAFLYHSVNERTEENKAERSKRSFRNDKLFKWNQYLFISIYFVQLAMFPLIARSTHLCAAGAAHNSASAPHKLSSIIPALALKIVLHTILFSWRWCCCWGPSSITQSIYRRHTNKRRTNAINISGPSNERKQN